jgi:hypothetical protein
MAAPSKVKAPAEWQWPEDVVAFAEANQVAHALQPLLEAAQKLVPNATFIKVYLEQDPEIRDERYIVFHVQVSGLGPPRSHEVRRKWDEELLRLCPGPLSYPFHFRLDLQP